MERQKHPYVQEFDAREFLFLVMLSAVAEANELRLPRRKPAPMMLTDGAEEAGFHHFTNNKVARTLQAVSQHCAGDHKKYVAACTRLFGLNKMLKHPRAKKYGSANHHGPMMMDPVLLAAARCPIRQFADFSAREFFAIVKAEERKQKSPSAERVPGAGGTRTAKA
jgi:hypothetical protein